MTIPVVDVKAKPHDAEVDYSASINLISTTDPQSNITHTNQHFSDVAGYTIDEMYHQPHNLVRHPDMPKQAFSQLWQYISSGKSWMGLVKNNCKNGGHYWVSAFVTPIKNANDEIIEYQSVRSKPDREAVNRASVLYKKMNTGKSSSLSELRFKQNTILFSLTVITLLILAAHLLTSNISLLTIATAVTTSCSLAIIWYTQNRIKHLTQLAKKAYNNPLMEYVYTGKKDEFSTIELALKMRQAELRAIVGRVSETSGDILQSAENQFSQTKQIQTNLAQQNDATEQVRVAMEQMSLSVRDISESAVQASSLTSEAQQMSSDGQNSVETTINSVHVLHKELDNSKSVINELSEDCLQIGGILDVIGVIADQTNLLALNAAIEAARAGEQGRGFAVVADEVRSLAQKTQASTGEIQQMIAKLQQTANQAVNSVDRGVELSRECNDQAAETGEYLAKINNKLNLVTDNSHQIASAVEEQVGVSDEISRNVEHIAQLSTATSKNGENAVEGTRKLVSRLEAMQRLMSQFQKY
ncbi:methyl-accepting chemotaxis protein [Moritella viscosa]|uniref:methyl-accepting chemotaxis protein n=1 Tax=Moritella viscosa TaxID=80854 RepID=UPI00091BE29A|nr:PAS domain-containing methyl-accepting chemotaxis protein [Moritella viscosa]SGZ04329.1 Putative methyl-accepting chemotaxis protein [Moritella viscosa]